MINYILMEVSEVENDNVFYNMYNSFLDIEVVTSLSSWAYGLLKGDSFADSRRMDAGSNLVSYVEFDGGEVVCADERFSDVLGRHRIAI
jgi:hypothetical protein